MRGSATGAVIRDIIHVATRRFPQARILVIPAKVQGPESAPSILEGIERACSKAKELGLKPFASIKGWATAGVDPAIMGTGPIPATKAALKKAGWDIADLDLVEANEAFAAQSLYVIRKGGWDMDKINLNGGAIALGHPIGASGARILTTLIYAMENKKAKTGLATLCIGGGEASALIVEKV